MAGRLAWQHPWQMASVDKEIFGWENPEGYLTREEIIRKYQTFAADR
jgi:hypothetical protein